MDTENKSWNYLDNLTKPQMIRFLKSQFAFRSPTKKSVLFFKWSEESDFISQAMDKHLSNSPDMSQRDLLAKKFNASTDINERMRLIDLMKPYEAALAKHLREYESIRAKEKANDKLYESINK